ncbi:hsp90 co-chaperone Cdc37 [Savitreella phatthalungensis]
MVLDYSKFDNIELSDDSDIEVHPNIDKKSFITWKQRDIHEKRELAKTQLDEYKKEIEINSTLLERTDALIAALKAAGSADNPKDILWRKLNSFPEKEIAPSRDGTEPPSYSKMMTLLCDGVLDEVQPVREQDRMSALTHKLSMHHDKLVNMLAKRRGDIAKLEQDSSRKITSDGLRDAWNYSSVTAFHPEAPYRHSILKTHPVDEATQTEPKAEVTVSAQSGRQASSEVDVTTSRRLRTPDTQMHGEEEALPERIEPSALGKQFGEIAPDDLDASLRFLGKHTNLLRDENETDGLLIASYYAEMKDDHRAARRYVHQGLLLQYCRQLGRDGVSLFFSRVRDPAHRAHRLFHDDVTDTLKRIAARARENKLEDEQSTPGASAGEAVEQIQLHAVDPGTKIAINVPVSDSSDPAIQECRIIYERLPEEMQAAVATQSLEAINTVLASMTVGAAEQVVEALSAGGMLSIEEEILDATKPDFVLPDRYAQSTAAKEKQFAPVSGEQHIEGQPHHTTPATPVHPSAVDDVD